MVDVPAPAQLNLGPALDAQGKSRQRSFTASWDALAGATSHTVRWRKTDAVFQDDDQVSANADATSADFSVSDDGTYEVELRVNGDSNLVAMASNELKVYSHRPGHLSLFYRQACKSNRITGIAAGPVDGGVEVRWTNPGVSSITRYQYQVQQGNGFTTHAGGQPLDNWTDVPGSDASTTSHTVTGLANGTTYGVLLRAVAGSRTYCFQHLIFVTPSDPTIGAPTRLWAGRVAGASRQVNLAWDDPDDNSLTYVYQFSHGSAWTAISGADPATADDGRLYTTITLPHCGGADFSFRIRAQRGSAVGPHSNTYNVPVIWLGTAGDDTITGDDGPDCIEGLGGNDTLNGAGGGDYLEGDNGDDKLYGGAGDDTLQGDAGSDYLSGGAGGDILNGGSGADTLIGGPGNDSLMGDYGDDIYYPGPGNDSLFAGGGNMKFYFDAATEFGEDKIWHFGVSGSHNPDAIYVCGGTAENPPTYSNPTITWDEWGFVDFEYVVVFNDETKGKIKGQYVLLRPWPETINLDNVNISTLPATHADCTPP